MIIIFTIYIFIICAFFGESRKCISHELIRRFTWSRRKKQSSSEPQDDESQEQSGSLNTHRLPHKSDEIIYPELVSGKMPTYFHIGGLAKECLITGYKIGAWQIHCTSKANENITFYSSGSGKPAFDQVSGGVGVSEKFGIFRSSQVWQTEGILGTLGMQTKLRNALVSVLMRGTYASYSRNGVKLELQADFEHSPLKVDLIIPILNEPTLLGYVVLEPAKNFMLGFQAIYDVKDKCFDKHALGVGYNNGNTEVGLKLENFKDLRGSLFQRIGQNWAFALKANLYSEEGKQFAVGGQYQLSKNGLLKAKLRNDGIFGMVYKYNMSDQIIIMYHFGLDAKAPIEGEHKIGLSWSLMC